MNRFRTKKKAKEAAEASARSSNDSSTPAIPPLKPTMTFRRKKGKDEPAPKMDLDLANALPASDDFRTSLLMTGLSARFSMLREQDDPKSKLGKASDDSVLFPKRQSRLNDFGFTPQGLSDIAEVNSISESTRRPWALDRMDSFQSAGSAETDTHDSIMSRGKPAEGNNLFGGRQKIYKIPIGGSTSMKNLSGEGTGLGGRALYGDDVSQSAFQKLKEREREEREGHNGRQSNDEPSSPYRSESPPLSGYNRNRETSSTTSSAPNGTRISTAATSVTSQRTPSVNGHSTPSTPAVLNGTGPERTLTKTKRLYETGLDQHLHTQQFSAANRLDNLSRQGRNLGARSPSPAASPISLPFEQGQQQQQFTSAGRQPKNPLNNPQSPNGGFDFGTKPRDGLKPFGAAPPLSPPASEGDDKSVLPIQPNDKGKATALGAFSKPVQPYDESKYTQRQLQMQQGRDTPPLRKHASPPAFLSNSASHEIASRNRAGSNATYQSDRSRSSSVQREFLPRERMFPPKREQAPPQPEPQPPSNTGSFLASPDGSEASSPRASEDTSKVNAWEQASAYDEFQPSVSAPMSKMGRRNEAEHPAFRQDRLKLRERDEQKKADAGAPATVSKISEALTVETKIDPPADSPTLPPASGLSGIIRQHLRSESNTSSIGGGPSSPILAPKFRASGYTVDGNPWDDNDWTDSLSNDAEYKQTTVPTTAREGLATTPGGFSSKQTTSRAVSDISDTPSWEKAINQHHSRDNSTESQKERDDFASELAARRKRVQENLRSFAESDSRSHSPVGSGVETPPLHKGAAPLRSNHLNFLKSKTSRDSLVVRSRDSSIGPQSKAMKMLGISTGAPGTSTPPSQMYDDHPHSSHHPDSDSNTYEPPRSGPRNGTGPIKNFRDKRRDAQRERERQVMTRHRAPTAAGSDSDDYSRWPEDRGTPRSKGEYSRERHPAMRTRSPSRDAPPVSYRGPRAPSVESGRSGAGSRPGTRDRSGSGASGGGGGGYGRLGGQGAGGTGRYQGEREPPRSVPDGMGAQHGGGLATIASPTLQPMNSPPPIPGGGSSSSAAPPSSRSRSGSRSQAQPPYFPPDRPPHLVLDPPSLATSTSTSPRPSPIAPFAINSTPALVPAPSPSSILSAATTPVTPHTPNITPSVSASSAPAGSSSSTAAGATNQRGVPGARKRSVNKSDISEPTFLSTTSRITTIPLPPQQQGQGGQMSAPPLPPMDPRRKTRTGMFWRRREGADDGGVGGGGFGGGNGRGEGGAEESSFSADEEDDNERERVKVVVSKPQRQRLRKSSSEGGNMGGKARAAVAGTGVGGGGSGIPSPNPMMSGSGMSMGLPVSPRMAGNLAMGGGGGGGVSPGMMGGGGVVSPMMVGGGGGISPGLPASPAMRGGGVGGGMVGGGQQGGMF